MIDTVVMTFSEDQFSIKDHDKFSPSTIGLYDGSYKSGGKAYLVCKQNPTAEEKKIGVYKPRLSVTKRFSGRTQGISLKVELSLPKLLLGNNLEELMNDDFYELIGNLVSILDEMGIEVIPEAIMNANISSVHFSKNIVLEDYSIPSQYLKHLTKLNINRSLDTNQTDFRNEGSSFKYRANTFEIAFYDKLKDIEQVKKSVKRSIDKDITLQEKLMNRNQFKKPFEVLRMEVRLNTRKKINSILKKLNIKEELTLNTIFNSDLSQKVLLHYLDEIESNYPPILLLDYSSPEQFLVDYMHENPKGGLSNALKYLGLKVALDKMGVRDFRNLIQNYSPNTWYRLNKQAKEIKGNKKESPFKTLRNQLQQFKPLKIEEYTVLNDDEG